MHILLPTEMQNKASIEGTESDDKHTTVFDLTFLVTQPQIHKPLI